MSEQYACQTIYGEPIVFGILGAFASLCALSDRHGQQIATTALDYRLPLYMGVDYQIETNESAQGRARVVLKDDRRTMMTSLFTFRGTRPPDGESDVPAIAPIHEQADWKPEELREDVQVTGRYAPSPEHLRALIQRWRLTEKGLTMPQVGVLLCQATSRACNCPVFEALLRSCVSDFVPRDLGRRLRSITRRGSRSSTSASACYGPRRN